METQNPTQKPSGSGKAVASLVLGILAIVFGGLVLGIIGIVLGTQAKKSFLAEGAPTGMATAGIVCSIIGTVLGSIIFVACYLPLLGLGTLGAIGSL